MYTKIFILSNSYNFSMETEESKPRGLIFKGDTENSLNCYNSKNICSYEFSSDFWYNLFS